MSDEEASHSKLSPSKAKRYLTCPGSVALADAEDTGNKYTAEGTAAHQLGEWCLSEGKDPGAYLGRVIVVEQEDGKYEFEVDEKMAGHVGMYVDYVRDLATDLTGDDPKLLVEHRVNLSWVLGEGEGGTADAIVFADGVIHVVDLKYGQGVRVDAVDNPQLQLYALGGAREIAAEEFDDYKHPVLAHIVQPRLGHISTAAYTTTQLAEIEDVMSTGAARVGTALNTKPKATDWNTPYGEAWVEEYLNPTEEGCRFCPAKATCPALRDFVTATVLDRKREEITDADWDDKVVEAAKDHLPLAENVSLGRMMARVDLLQSWASAVQEEVGKRLRAGITIPGWKLVKGNKGPSQWTDPKAAEALLKSFRLRKEDMYSHNLVSPSAARKLVADSEARVKRIALLVRETGGHPTVAPETDKRPAIAKAEEADYTDLTD